jgi:cellulose synthase/poly-beta-1,6-N-acetylglucosamine synthase-like glycosyltransferase
VGYPQFLEIDRAVFVLSIGFYCLLGSTFFWTLAQYLRRRRAGLATEAELLAAPLPAADELPTVLVQLPTYNEGALIGRICAAVSEFDWPRDRL